MAIPGIVQRRDFLAGLMLTVVGCAAAAVAATYPQGTLMRMGPGFLPLVLGVLLALLGVAVAATAAPAAGDDRAMPRADWRGWLLVVAGPVLFVAFARYGGLAPATFACVFVSALGDRRATWRGSALLALCTTVFGVLLFAEVLRVPMPIWHPVAPW